MKLLITTAETTETSDQGASGAMLVKGRFTKKQKEKVVWQEENEVR